MFRVRTEQGAAYGSFADYELALGQARHLTDRRRRHKQAATVEEASGPSEPWREVIRLEANGQGPKLSASRPSRRRRISVLAEPTFMRATFSL